MFKYFAYFKKIYMTEVINDLLLNCIDVFSVEKNILFG